MLYAIAKVNGKQYKLTEGKELNVDRLPAKVGQKVDIKDILLVSQDDTKLIGADAKKATVKASVTAELLGPKVLVFKHKKRKRYRKLVGHRQALSRIKIETIDFPGKKKEEVRSPKSEVGSKKSKVAAEGSHPFGKLRAGSEAKRRISGPIVKTKGKENAPNKDKEKAKTKSSKPKSKPKPK